MPGVPPCTTDHPSGLIDNSNDSDDKDFTSACTGRRGGGGQSTSSAGVLDDVPAPAQPPADEFHTPPASPPAPAAPYLVFLPLPLVPSCQHARDDHQVSGGSSPMSSLRIMLRMRMRTQIWPFWVLCQSLGLMLRQSVAVILPSGISLIVGTIHSMLFPAPVHRQPLYPP